MKKNLLALISSMTVAANSHAALVFSDTFSYPNGFLTAVSGGIWSAHSGVGANAIGVTNGQIRVQMISAGSEDVNAGLGGAPYLADDPAAKLYSSYTLILSNTVPTLSGTYISHFRGTNTGPATDFGARVFLSATNTVSFEPVPAGKFRISIGNGSGAVNPVEFGQVDQDFDTNTVYTVVTRFVPSTGLATIWVNPNSELDPGATASDVGTPVAPNPFNVFTYAFRQGSQTPSGTTSVWIDDLKVGTAFSDVAGADTSPLISAIPNQNAPANTPVGPLGFTVQDAETVPATGLTVSSNSSNPTLVPNESIAVETVANTGGTNRTVTITPATGQQGQTTITLTVSDGVNSSPTSFQLTVGAPTISPIPNQTTTTDTPTAAIPFSVNDAEGDSLVLSSNSSNPTLISDANIVITGVGATRTVTLTPESGQQGLTTITISVTDGFSTNSQKFAVTVSPSLGVIFSDDFSYPDGTLLGNGTWSTSSGTPGQMLVTNGTVQISQSLGEDMNTGSGFTGGSPFAPASGVVLYAGFTINATQLPTSAGNYFAHFKDSSTGFRARIFTSRANAAPGNFRIGIANSAGAVSGEVATDLATNTTYQIVSRYNVGTGESVVWVNPASAAAPGVAAKDAPSTITVAQYGLRQDSSMGTLYLDNLKIGTSMADVVTILTPLAPTLTNSVVNGELVLSWGNPQFVLQSAPTLTGTFTTIPGANSPYTNSLSGSEAYFRLKY
jgi:hypothetical protein